jgi:hypothetical protein
VANVVQRAAASFQSALLRFLAGGFIVLVVDVAAAAVSEPSVLACGHRFFAALLPCSVLLSVPVAIVLAVLPIRLTEPRTTTWGWRRWLAVVLLLPAIGAAGTWVLKTGSMQMPVHATVVAGFTIGVLGLAAICLATRQAPPAALLYIGALVGVLVSKTSFHLVTPELAILPALTVWVFVAMSPAAKFRWLAAVGAIASVAGLLGFERDLGGVSRIDRYSFAAEPFVLAVRSAIDFDADGWSPILAGGDCDDFNDAIHPWAVETVGNGRDENCIGGDLRRSDVPGDGEAAPRSQVRQGTRPDVVFLSLDGVRADRVTVSTMPLVSALAKRVSSATIKGPPESVVFHDHACVFG